MRKSLLILLTSLLLLSCGSIQMEENLTYDEVDYYPKESVDISKLSLFGEWKWVESYINIDPDYFTSPTEYSSKTITITKDGNYQESHLDQKEFNKKYQIKKRVSLFDGKTYDAIIIEDWHDQLIELYVGTDIFVLELTENIETGSTFIYHKKIPKTKPTIVPSRPYKIKK